MKKKTYVIKVIQAPKALFFDENNGREMESIISINGDTEINGIEIWINAEESPKGSNFYFRNESNREIMLKNSSLGLVFQSGTLMEIDVDDPIYDIQQDIYEILEKLATATLYDELGKEGDELNSEDILNWEF